MGMYKFSFFLSFLLHIEEPTLEFCKRSSLKRQAVDIPASWGSFSRTSTRKLRTYNIPLVGREGCCLANSSRANPGLFCNRRDTPTYNI